MDTIVSARAALLQALAGGPGYGTQLIARVRSRTGGRVSLLQGSVYPALQALEQSGLAESYVDADAVALWGGRPRRYYRLTALGQAAVDRERSALLGLFRLAG